MSECQRCTGHCCRCLAFPLSPEELADGLLLEQESLAYEKGQGPYPVTVRPDGSRRVRPIDIDKIAPMLEHLGDGPPGSLPGSPRPRPDPDMSQVLHFYRCRNLQPNGDCGIYETRPLMCRDYPYGEACRHDGCTMRPNPPAVAGASTPDPS